MAELAIQGMTGLLEHPAEPSPDDFPSIWMLPLVQLLFQIPGVRRLSLSQGLLGADSPKPTELLVVNTPTVEKHVCAWRVTPALPRHTNIGQDSRGSFRTAQLKEYPPAFCAALASCTVDALDTLPINPSVTIEASFLEHCLQMVSRDFGTHIGPDFAK